jgi:hypothetical protein
MTINIIIIISILLLAKVRKDSIGKGEGGELYGLV